MLFEAQGGEDRFPAGPRALLRWFQIGRNRLGRIKKGWPVVVDQQLARWCHDQGCVVRSPRGRGSIPGWAASYFTLVSDWKGRLSRIKKVRMVNNWHGGVIVKAVLFEAQGGQDRLPAGPRAFLYWFQIRKNLL